MKSMTGYGMARRGGEGREVSVEVRSVNHRYLDIGLRMPRSLGFAEDLLRKGIGQWAARGHFDVFVNYRNTRADARTVTLNEGLAQAYCRAFDGLRSGVSLRDDLTLATLARMPDVLQVAETEEDQEAVCALISQALEDALAALNAMRLREGEQLKLDCRQRLETLERQLRTVEERAPLVVREYQQRLHARIEELMGAAPDPVRIAQEVAQYADRCAVDEETVRLNSHIAQFRAALEAGDPVGRRLDFLVQEMNREVNTIGSKAADLTITNCVLAMKNEIEKIREQVQNIE